jgi:hypothetical protein
VEGRVEEKVLIKLVDIDSCAIGKIFGVEEKLGGASIFCFACTSKSFI